MIPFYIPCRPRGLHDHDCVYRIDEYHLSVIQSAEPRIASQKRRWMEMHRNRRRKTTKTKNRKKKEKHVRRAGSGRGLGGENEKER